MEVALFWIFAALMLGFGAAVIFLKSPVSSALSLVVSFLGLAALFLLLDAFFIGIIQVLVYAGAVMVLFLFIIMLLDLKTERARKFNIPALIGGLMVVVGFIALLVKLLPGFDIASPHAPVRSTTWPRSACFCSVITICHSRLSVCSCSSPRWESCCSAARS